MSKKTVDEIASWIIFFLLVSVILWAFFEDARSSDLEFMLVKQQYDASTGEPVSKVSFYSSEYLSWSDCLDLATDLGKASPPFHDYQHPNGVLTLYECVPVTSEDKK